MFRTLSLSCVHTHAAVNTLLSCACIHSGCYNQATYACIDDVTAFQQAVIQELGAAGFHLAFSWKYPGSTRAVDLDHAFLRGLKLLESSTFANDSDHLGTKLVVVRG